MELDFNELRELLTVINQTDIAEFTLKSGEFELVLRKGMQLGELPATPPPVIPPSTVPPVPIAPPLPSVPPAAVPTAAPAKLNDKLVDVISPMVGTFYRSPAPDERPFVDVGDRIRPGQTVCIIEAMKLMNELEAEFSGEIVEVLVKNGEPVEYGQVLMRVNPA
ncbi:acetyl-CoA carboxylase biotin carboxyl carrier protein [Phormidium tenue FACHB-886]|nr:acetyl-CoA carboxylase biotin carboxyl carrier protein [Phormidium tenue FACHB-886]